MPSSLTKNALYNMTYHVVRLLFPIITFPYVSRIIGPSGIGQVNYGQTLAQYFVIAGTLGIPAYGTRLIAQVRNDKPALSKATSELLVIGALLSSLATALYFFLPTFIPLSNINPVLYRWFGIIVLVSFGRSDWFFVGTEEYRYITMRNLLVRIVSLGSVFLLVRDSNDFILYGGIWIAGTGFTSLLNVTRVVHRSSFTLRGISPLRHLKAVIPTFGITVSETLFRTIDLLMIGLFVHDNGVSLGLFALAGRVSRIIFSLAEAVLDVMIPRISHLLKKGKSHQAQLIISKNLLLIALVGFPLTVGLYQLTPEIVHLFGGKAFYDAIPTMRILAFTLLPQFLRKVLAQHVLYPHEKERPILVVTLFSLFTAVLLNLWLIPRYTHTGAALATLITRTIEVFLLFLIARPFIAPLKGVSAIVSAFFATLCMAGIVALIRYVLSENTFVVRAIFGILSGIVSYSIIVLSLRNPLALEIWGHMRYTKRKR